MAKSKRQQREEAKLTRQEKQFFKYALVITFVLLVIAYIFFIK